MCHSKTIEVIKSKQVVSPERVNIYRQLVNLIQQLDSLHNTIIQARKHVNFCRCKVCKNLRESEAARGSAAHLYQYIESNYQRLTHPYLNRIIINLTTQFRLNLVQQNSLE